MGRSTASLKAILGVLFVAITLGACATVPITGRSQLNMVADQQVVSSADQFFSKFMQFVHEKNARLSSSESPQASAWISSVNRVSERIIDAAGVRGRYQWEAVVVKSRVVNAFAIPNGKIVVFTGLLPVAETDAGLAAIIGHEVAHVVARHGAERMSQALMAQIVLDTANIALAIKNPRYQPAIGAALGLGAHFGVLLPFSRLHESEADLLGLFYMAKAGYDPAEAIGVWQRMEARAGGSGRWEYLSTHPSPATRRSQLNAWLPEAKLYYTDTSRPLPSSLAEVRTVRTSAPIPQPPTTRSMLWTTTIFSDDADQRPVRWQTAHGFPTESQCLEEGRVRVREYHSFVADAIVAMGPRKGDVQIVNDGLAVNVVRQTFDKSGAVISETGPIPVFAVRYSPVSTREVERPPSETDFQRQARIPRQEVEANERKQEIPTTSGPERTARAAVTVAVAANPTAASTQGISAPIWKFGDGWAYRYETPKGSGTYVWSVDREEKIDGVPHYVIKTGTRRIFYRKSDLALSRETIDGVIVAKHTPSRLNYMWPLYVGQRWDQTILEESPKDRQTVERVDTVIVEAEETVTVPAGTFKTYKIVHRNKRTGIVGYEVWYSPQVKQWVKIRENLDSGLRTRELISFDLL